MIHTRERSEDAAALRRQPGGNLAAAVSGGGGCQGLGEKRFVSRSLRMPTLWPARMLARSNVLRSTPAILLPTLLRPPGCYAPVVKGQERLRCPQ